jgi:uncharacterized membrane protein
MEFYHLFLFVHVVCAVLWLGGSAALMFLAWRADREGDAGGLLSALRMVGVLAPRVFVPGSTLVLVTGLAMVWTGSLAWEAWIVLALGGIAVTIGIGAGVLGPLSGKAAEAEAAGRIGEAATLGQRVVRLAKVDLVMLFGIVWLMVMKPGWAEVWMLAVPAVAVVVAAVMAVVPGGRQVAA